MDVTLRQASDLWWRGDLPGDAVLWWCYIYWWGRIGMFLSGLAGAVLALDIAGPDRIALYIARHNRKLNISTFVTHSFLALLAVLFLFYGDSMLPIWLVWIVFTAWLLLLFPVFVGETLFLVSGVFKQVTSHKAVRAWLRRAAIACLVVGFFLNILAA